MYESGERILDGTTRPDAKAVAAWIGPKNYKRWTAIVKFIEGSYPGVFSGDDWLFGGKKHGWGLRFKKSKSFCTLIPERNRLAILIVFGAAEREKAEAVLSELSPDVCAAYEAATTYHDGKWLYLVVDRDVVLDDVKRLLTIKRRPKGK
jgi:hypothetical protein